MLRFAFPSTAVLPAVEFVYSLVTVTKNRPRASRDKSFVQIEKTSKLDLVGLYNKQPTHPSLIGGGKYLPWFNSVH